jgi:glycerophosphoryl diester phosphodiesterase
MGPTSRRRYAVASADGRRCSDRKKASATRSAIRVHPRSSAVPPLLFAHRGASGEAPENTLEAFRLAWVQGADGIECDVHRTRDGRLVCIHDADTRRTTGVKRRVAASTWAQLRALDAGVWKGARWAGARIPLLEEVLGVLPRGKRIQVEVKAGVGCVPRLVALLRAVPAYRKRVIVIAFETDVVRAVKRAAPELTVLWLTAYSRRGLRWHPTTEAMLATLRACGADGVGSQAHGALTAARVTALRAAGFAVTAWTVDRVSTARRLAALGIDGIATNWPGHLRDGGRVREFGNG